MNPQLNVRDKAFELVKSQGPLIPSLIAKELGTNILLASAILSELSSSNLIKISSLKIGGSPLYYAPGQEDKLQNYSDKLNEKEKRAYELLKEKKILKDNQLDALTRFCLRQIKDFAKPLEVTTEKEKELYWGWYLLSKEEASSLIEKELSAQEMIEEKMSSEMPSEAKIMPEEEDLEKIPEAAVAKEQKIEPEPKEAKDKKTEEKETKKLKPKIKKEAKKEDFMEKASGYFKKKGIEIIESVVLKKNSEIDFLIRVPSAIGATEHYCKAKNKKRPTDADLSTAFAHGQLKKLPVVFLASGDLTKKGKELLKKLENVNFEKIE